MNNDRLFQMVRQLEYDIEQVKTENVQLKMLVRQLEDKIRDGENTRSRGRPRNEQSGSE